MATHTCKVLLSLARIMKSPALTPHSRVTYATFLSTNNRPNSNNKGLPERGNRGGPRRPRRESGEPRTERMAVDQDWTAVYPAWAPFRPGSVPLPVRMGKPMRGGVPPEKKGNLELIKIANFLHLTPAAIKKHCDTLKPFCNEWPSALESDAVCDEHFPIKVESTDYVHAGTSIRNPSARIVYLKAKLSSFNLDDHARKKMVKLLGDRYCKQTDILSITTDSCPLKQQNSDYAMYLLTVLYHESWKTEAWEAEKTVADMEEYSWEDSPSQKNILDMFMFFFVRMKPVALDGIPGGPQLNDGELVVEEGDAEAVREEVLGRAEVQEYRDCVTRLKNEGESESAVLQYREAVRKLYNL